MLNTGRQISSLDNKQLYTGQHVPSISNFKRKNGHLSIELELEHYTTHNGSIMTIRIQDVEVGEIGYGLLGKRYMKRATSLSKRI